MVFFFLIKIKYVKSRKLQLSNLFTAKSYVSTIKNGKKIAEKNDFFSISQQLLLAIFVRNVP